MRLFRTVNPIWWSPLVGVLAAAIILPQPTIPAADHRDGPIFGTPGVTITNSRRDINDVYAFQAPGNINNTVLILTVSPFAGGTTPTTFDQGVVYDIKVDNNQDAVEDITFRVTFTAPIAGGAQPVTLRALPSTRFPPTGILARGNTGQNLPIAGGGMFRAAIQDDAFFFDVVGFNNLLNPPAPNPLPRPVGTAANFFANSNVLTMILELPTAKLRSSPSNPNIGVWATNTLNNVQIDRMGRPAISSALIPPIPRGSNFPIGQGGRLERRNAFNAGLPRNDRRDFRTDMIGILGSVYGRPRDMTANPPLTSADGIANLLLPDILTFDTNTAFTTNALDGNGFPNGRRLRDDVIDVELGLLTNGGITTDNVGDDNADLITDGTMRADTSLRPVAFPYIGTANNPGVPVPGPAPPP